MKPFKQIEIQKPVYNYFLYCSFPVLYEYFSEKRNQTLITDGFDLWLSASGSETRQIKLICTIQRAFDFPIKSHINNENATNT